VPLPRVLILGERAAVAVPAVRSLARAGFEVDVAGRRPREEAARSRHVRRYFRLKARGDHAAEWEAEVRWLVESHGHGVLVATTDRGVARLIEASMPIPTCPSIDRRHLALVDKRQLADLCRLADVPYPRTTAPEDGLDDDALAASIVGPAIVKAARPAFVQDDGSVSTLGGAVAVDDARAAARAIAAVRRRGLVPIVQDRVGGEKWQATVLRRGHITQRRLAFRVVREYPARRGSETMLEAVSTSDGLGQRLVESIERLLDAAGYEGIAGAEFLVRQEDGAVHVVDVNPRLTGSLAFAERLGLGIAEAAVRDALGLAQRTVEVDPAGRRYHHLTRELRWLVEHRGIPPGYLGTFGRGDVWDLPPISDPLPGVARVLRRLADGQLRGAG
jgi:predicted ATP-grasp superfamily ATP-dependent carboligase